MQPPAERLKALVASEVADPAKFQASDYMDLPQEVREALGRTVVFKV
jgi:hypothetical protein